MSLAYYEQIEAKLDLYEKIAVAEIEKTNNASTITHEEFINSLRSKYYV